ncbi:BnaCnng05120D [Brassica napus]|uniref:BnaCnng05120D protein n=1 Tax=Brassica napus TaxID=3708 RepID=A0A078GRZ9_BRANA|nr:BnaCnng05120D [Brassica napus]
MHSVWPLDFLISFLQKLLPCRLAVVKCILLEWFKKSSLLCKSESSFLKVKALSLIFFPAILSWRMWEHTALESIFGHLKHSESLISRTYAVPSKQLALQIQFPLFLCSFAVNSYSCWSISFLMNQHAIKLILGETGSICVVVVKMYISLEFFKKRSHSPLQASLSILHFAAFSFCLCLPPSVQPSSSPLRTSEGDDKYANVKWEELGFSLIPTDCMYVAKCRQGESFREGKIVPYGDISISPCSPIFSTMARDYLKV